MVMAASPGPMEALTKASLSITTLRAKVSTTGATREFTKENGKITKWKVQEHLNGQMVVNTLVSTSTIKRRGRALSTGQTVVNTMASG